jgi:hypothetical protein
MTQYLVFVRDENGKLKGIGEHKFDQVPRIGEFVGIDDLENNSGLYKVVLVLHVTSGKREITGNSGELYITPAKYEPGLELYFVEHHVSD